MASVAQAEASRVNGAMSQGPVTEEGKERSSRNAMRHGLAADRFVLIDQEDAEEFRLYREAFLADLAPEGALEDSLAERIVVSSWRLRRAARLEADMMDDDLEDAKIKRSDRAKRSGRKEPTGPLVSWQVGEKFKEAFGGPRSSYDALGRYERRIERGLFSAVRELRELQKERERRQCHVRRHASPSPPGEACPDAQAGPPQEDRLPLEDSRKPGTGPGAQEQVAAPGEVLGLPRTRLEFIEEAERSGNASLRAVAAGVRAKLGLPPATES